VEALSSRARTVDFGDFVGELAVTDPAMRDGLEQAVRWKAKDLVREGLRIADGKPERSPNDVAAELGLDLSRECPVCRSVERCGCPEPDRAFIRRTRFVPGLAGVPRCPGCRGPISTFYVRVRASEGEPTLGDYGGLHGCAACQGAELAVVLRSLSACPTSTPKT
jgi:hypothetical protein